MTIYVMNPNSSADVTARMDAALDPLRRFGVPITCTTLSDGPSGIEDQRQADLVIAPLLQQAATLPNPSAFVVACFGDPGLHALRVQSAVPVLGIQESAVLTALSLGQRFGVLAILPASIPRHMRAFGAMGVRDRCAGDRALNLRVNELADEARVLARMVEIGTRLRDEDGADVLILGCAGMASYSTALSDALNIPVVEPCQAATAMALGRIALGY